MITTLEKLGLSEKEAKVYLAALELGAESVQNIAKKAGVNRATTYVILESLAKLGLASSYEKGKKTFFVAEAPEQLDRLLKKQEEDIEERRSELKKFIPELDAIFNLSAGKPKVRYYEGIEGSKLMVADSINFNGKGNNEIFAFTPLDKYMEYYPREESSVNRINRNVKLKVIYTHINGPISGANDVKKLRTARFVPRKLFPFNSMIDIYPEINRVSIYNFKPVYGGIIIDDEKITQTFKAIFDLSWKGAKEYQ